METLENLPLERFEILPDEDSAATDHLIAVHGLIQECVDVRRYLQYVWHDVAYDEFNSTFAWALTNTAVAAVTRRVQKLLEEYGGSASFEAVNEVVTGGDTSKIQGQLGMPFTSGEERKWAEIDVMEQFMLHASVQLYMYPVATRIAVGEDHKWEEIDWSPTGPCSQRWLFGLNEFASFITTLATQKLGAPIEDKVRHHHILQLQLLVNSYAVTQGWAVHVMVLETPTAGFECMRDIQVFLDYDEERATQGFLLAVEWTIEQLTATQGKASGSQALLRLSSRQGMRSISSSANGSAPLTAWTTPLA